MQNHLHHSDEGPRPIDRPDDTKLSASRAIYGNFENTPSIPVISPPAIQRSDSVVDVIDTAAIAPTAPTSRRGFLMNTIVSAASLATAATVAAQSITAAAARAAPAIFAGDPSSAALAQPPANSNAVAGVMVDADIELIELGNEYERLLSIERPLRDESNRLWDAAHRLSFEKLGIDPDNHGDIHLSTTECQDAWLRARKLADTDVGYDKAYDKAKRASTKTVHIGRKLLKIKPTTIAGLLVRVHVIETHDEICKLQPAEQLLTEIKDFASGVSKRTADGLRREVTAA